ncbi:hypothetical protein [Pseudomonas sp. DG56-2]|uniref:hypothetical protein n=1 Tax=Pseudomonas sp. DG56-2 TaxID=2320270 RepID=UPI0010A63ACA|nr:hypothetical protein [Pseudomonas sp. DG56-2]
MSISGYQPLFMFCIAWGFLMGKSSTLHLALFTDENLPIPRVPAVVKDEAGNDNPEGIVARSALDLPLEVVVPEWDFSTRPGVADVLELGWRPEGAAFYPIDSQTLMPPIAPGDKALHVPANLLLQGSFSLSYRVTRLGNTTDSFIKRITVDRLPPNENQRPSAAQFPDDLVGVITDDYLIEHGEVVARVPPYLGLQALDRAVFYWSELDPLPDDTVELGARTFTQADIDAKYLPLPVAEEAVRAGGAGRRFLSYRLYDLAGNESPLSYVAPIQVDLVPAPSNLPAPRVPLSVRGFIDRQHARDGADGQGGVTVEIDAYDNALPNHFVVLSWGSQELLEFPVDPSAFPLVVYVPWRKLIGDGLGPDRVQVSYRIRYGASYSQPSPSTLVSFDFTIAGQDHANAPALLNPTLALVEVRGVLGRPNQLTAQDEGLDAHVLLTLFEDPQPGEYLEVFWGAVVEPAARYDVQPGDVAGKQLDLLVPWRIVEQDKNNVALPVYYVTNNGVNQQQALATAVSVVIVPIVGLPTPVFPHADLHGYLNCGTVPALWTGVTIHVAGDENFAQGDLVEVTWQGFKSLGGNGPIPSTQLVISRVLSLGDAKDGFDVVVLPYSTHIEPLIDNASATASYNLIKADGGFGRSARELVSVTRKMPSGDICGPDKDR